MEPFVLIIAHHDDDIGIDHGELVAELLHGAAITFIPFLAHLEAGLFLEIHLPAPRFDQLREIVDAPAERMLLVLAIIGGAQIPAFRRGRQQRPVRGAEAKDDISHGAFLLAYQRRSPGAVHDVFLVAEAFQ